MSTADPDDFTPEDYVREVLDLIDRDQITPNQKSALQSALFRHTGRGIGQAVSSAIDSDPRLAALFRPPVIPKEKDYGLEDVSDGD